MASKLLCICGKDKCLQLTNNFAALDHDLSILSGFVVLKKTGSVKKSVREAYLKCLVPRSSSGGSGRKAGQSDATNDTSKDSPEHNDRGDGRADKDLLYVAIHHFPPQVVLHMGRSLKLVGVANGASGRIEVTSPPWESLFVTTLQTLLLPDEPVLLQEIFQDANCVRQSVVSGAPCDRYIVLPNYSLNKAEEVLSHIKKNSSDLVLAEVSLTATSEAPPEGTNGEEKGASIDEGKTSNTEEASSFEMPLLQSPEMNAQQIRLVAHYESDLCPAEMERRSRIKLVFDDAQAQWDECAELILNGVVEELTGVQENLKRSYNNWKTYGENLIKLNERSLQKFRQRCAASSPAYSKRDAVAPLRDAFAEVGRDWKQELDTLTEGLDELQSLSDRASMAVGQIKGRFASSMERLAGLEAEIVGEWMELEEACLLAKYNVKKNMSQPYLDCWLREVSYRRFLHVQREKLEEERNNLERIFRSVSELQQHCHGRVSELLLELLPKRRRMFSKTRDVWEPVLDNAITLASEESASVTNLEKKVEDAVSAMSPRRRPQKKSSILDIRSAMMMSWSSASKVMGPSSDPDDAKELANMATLVESSQIHDVKVMLLKTKDWIPVFGVTTRQHNMHFFGFELGEEDRKEGISLKDVLDEERADQTARLVRVLEGRGIKEGAKMEPIVSVALDRCSYGISHDGNYVEMAPHDIVRLKEFMLDFGSQKAASAWVTRTKRWVNLFYYQ